MKSSQWGNGLLSKSVLIATILGSVAGYAQTTAPAGTSTTSTAAATESVLNKMTLTLANETSNSLDAARTRGGADTVNVMSLSYKAQENLKLAATLTQKYTFVGNGEDQALQRPEYFDLGLSATTTHGGILGTEKTPVKYMFNLPTSQKSRDSKQAFSLGAEVSLGYELTNNISSGVKIIPVWASKNGASDQLRNEIYGELRYAHTSKLSSYGFLDHKIKVKTETDNAKLNEIAAAGLGVSYSPLKVVDLDLAVARERHIFASTVHNQSAEFTLLDPKEISYTAAAVVRF